MFARMNIQDYIRAVKVRAQGKPGMLFDSRVAINYYSQDEFGSFVMQKRR